MLITYRAARFKFIANRSRRCSACQWLGHSVHGPEKPCPILWAHRWCKEDQGQVAIRLFLRQMSSNRINGKELWESMLVLFSLYWILRCKAIIDEKKVKLTVTLDYPWKTGVCYHHQSPSKILFSDVKCWRWFDESRSTHGNFSTACKWA